MAGLLDFLFGAGPLKKAATDTGTDQNYKPADADAAQRNADYAAKRTAAAAPAASGAPATPPAPKPITVTKKKPTTVEQGVGGQLMSTKQ